MSHQDTPTETSAATWQTAVEVRSKRFAQAKNKDLHNKPCAVLKFRLGKERYAIAADSIVSSQTLRQITPLPFLSAPYLGVTLVRGSIIPIIDLRHVFQFPQVGLSDRNYVIVIADQDDQLGLLADHIFGIETIDLDALQTKLANLNELRQRLLLGITDDNFIVLSGSALLFEPQLKISTPR